MWRERYGPFFDMLSISSQGAALGGSGRIELWRDETPQEELLINTLHSYST
jgi:hypothetical protein